MSRYVKVIMYFEVPGDCEDDFQQQRNYAERCIKEGECTLDECLNDYDRCDVELMPEGFDPDTKMETK